MDGLWLRASYLHNTGERAISTQGNDFAPDLSDEQPRALMEYLKNPLVNDSRHCGAWERDSASWEDANKDCGQLRQ